MKTSDISKTHIRNWNFVRGQDVIQRDKAPTVPGFGLLASRLSVTVPPCRVFISFIYSTNVHDWSQSILALGNPSSVWAALLSIK